MPKVAAIAAGFAAINYPLSLVLFLIVRKIARRRGLSHVVGSISRGAVTAILYIPLSGILTPMLIFPVSRRFLSVRRRRIPDEMADR